MNFEAAYRSHFAAVWRTVRRLGVADKDAPDAAQEVFLIAFRRWNEFEGRSSARTWLLGIAYRVAADRRRSAPARREVLYGDESSHGPIRVDPNAALEQRELVRILDNVLDSLPLEQRAVFTMYEMEGLTGEEIAAVLGIAEGTVRSRLRLARAAFSRAVALAARTPSAVRACGEER